MLSVKMKILMAVGVIIAINMAINSIMVKGLFFNKPMEVVAIFKIKCCICSVFYKVCRRCLKATRKVLSM